MESIREKVKNSVLERTELALKEAEAAKLLKGKDPSAKAQVADHVHRYCSLKFLLLPEECYGKSLLDMAELSLEKALDMKLPIAKESEVATTCGAAASGAMKIALLLTAVRKDFEINVSSYRLGLVADTVELGDIVWRAMQGEVL